MSIISNLTGWVESSFADYQLAYTAFGGSTISNPEILTFIHSRFDLKERFYIKRNQMSELIAGICVWDNNFIAGDQKIVKKHGIDRYPLNFDEIVLPVAPDVSLMIPFRTKFLSVINHKTVINSHHRLNAHRQISIVRTVSTKTSGTRNRELRKFLEAGGTVHDVSEYASETLMEIYADLFYLRRGKRPDMDMMREILQEIPDLLFGTILFYKDMPCAMQWVVKSEDNHRVYLDYVNAGMNMELPPHLSVGTLTAWMNIRSALEYGKKNNKEIRFSFGRPTADYKDRWCNREPLYRVFS